MWVVLGMGVVFGAVACFLWAAFLVFLGRCIFDLLTTGAWPISSLNSYFDHQFARPFGEAWVGWYILAAIALAMLASAACVSPILLERRRR